jgi:hypothetical protein
VKHALVAILFAVLATAMTWPLAPNLCCASADAEDPFINTWILDWDWYATLHQPLSLFQANTFFPARDSLAFSENLYGIGLLLFPLRAAGLEPLAAHNVAMIAGFAFCGFAAYVLGLILTGNVVAGIAAGVFYAFVPFRFTHLTHVQHVWGGWLPMMLAALLHYARRPTWGRAALFGTAFLMNGLSNVHWFLFGSIVIVLSIPIAVSRRDWLRVAVAIAVAMLLLAPFLVPYATVSRLYNMRRSWGEVMESSARLGDWLNPGTRNRLYGKLVNIRTNPETWLFPGALGIALAAAGIVAARRERRHLGVALLWIAAGFVGSLGLHTFFYRALFSYAPGFQAVRVPARWANIAYVGMAMLIAFAAAAPRRRWVGAAIAAAFVIELRAAPIRWYLSPAEAPAAHRWLATQNARVAELPMNGSADEYWYTRWSTAHHRPIANGASGFAPPEYVKLVSLWNALDDRFVAELKSAGVDTFIVHGDSFGPRERAWLRRELESNRIFFVRRFVHEVDGDWVFSLRAGQRNAPELDAFLRGQRTFNDATFGLLNYPLPNERLKGAFMSGFALSPYGIRSVDFLFNNGAIRVPASFWPDPAVSKQFPWYDATPRPRFVAAFKEKPQGVWRHTDVQVEIVDGRGHRTRLGERWVEWR